MGAAADVLESPVVKLLKPCKTVFRNFDKYNKYGARLDGGVLSINYKPDNSHEYLFGTILRYDNGTSRFAPYTDRPMIGEFVTPNKATLYGRDERSECLIILVIRTKDDGSMKIVKKIVYDSILIRNDKDVIYYVHSNPPMPSLTSALPPSQEKRQLKRVENRLANIIIASDSEDPILINNCSAVETLRQNLRSVDEKLVNRMRKHSFWLETLRKLREILAIQMGFTTFVSLSMAAASDPHVAAAEVGNLVAKFYQHLSSTSITLDQYNLMRIFGDSENDAEEGLETAFKAADKYVQHYLSRAL